MRLPDWSYPNPVFVDFETQSEFDIKEGGGRLYTEHPSTRILIMVLAHVDKFHVWIPDYVRVDTSIWNPSNLWPYQLQPKQEVRFYRGDSPPADLIESIAGLPTVAHNAYGFDRQIWNRFIKTEQQWLDSMLLAKASGRPGRLDALGKAILGVGKDRASKLLPKLTAATKSKWTNGYTYPVIKPGDLQAFTTYAIGDVELMRQIWRNEFDDMDVEADVIAAHDSINSRGVMVDSELLNTIERLSEYSCNIAIDDICHMTNGAINGNNIRSTKQIHEWLERYGVSVTDDNGKPCLRKEIVAKFIDSPYVIQDNLKASVEIPPIVITVLKLRMKALRITDAKVKRAKQRVSMDGRIRDLHSYHQAHTGRFSSQGVQIHNLPRPAKGIDIQAILKECQGMDEIADTSIIFDRIKKYVPVDETERNPLTIDDVASALIRPSLMPRPGCRFILSDYGQVEARGAAWSAGETKMLHAFAQHRDLYKEFAKVIFHIPLDEVNEIQRQVAKNAILGCQYGLGPDKFRVYAANNGADLTAAGVTAEYCIETYRNTYTKICGFKPDRNESFRTGGVWHNLDRAVKQCVAERIDTEAGKCRFVMRGKNLLCILPSGRCIRYPDARIEDVVPGYCYTLRLPLIPKATVVYTSPRGMKSLYGGLIFENCIQAICRDLLVDAMVRLEMEGMNPVLHVHDEIVCEVPEQTADEDLRKMVRIMSTVPKWASGFPVVCEGFVSPRFVKKAFKGMFKFETKELVI